jgi:hypothetical protein
VTVVHTFEPLSRNRAAIFAAGWVDLAQHLVQVWRWVEEILEKYDLLTVGLAESSLVKAKEAPIIWLLQDYCAALLTEGDAMRIGTRCPPPA